MIHIFFVFLILLVYEIEPVKSLEIAVAEGHDTCKDDSCLSKSFNKSQKPLEISHNFHFANGSVSEKDVYFMKLSGKSSEIPLDKNSHIQKLAPGIKVQVFSEGTEKSSLSTDFVEEQSSVTDLIEVNNITSQDFSGSTVEPNITKVIQTTTVKLSVSTTWPPFVGSHSILLKNNKKIKNICLCDIQVNYCDINCCCDYDCNISHFKVFTKCNDDNVMIDRRYCYKTNFIFGNNTFHEVIQSSGGLFCIVRENAKDDLNFKVKVALKSLEDFNKSLPENVYGFSYKSAGKMKVVESGNYFVGLSVWSIQRGELKPFKILYSSAGVLCNSEVKIKYLVEEVKTCFYQQQSESHCLGSKIKEILQNLRNTKVICKPDFLIKSGTFNSLQICKSNVCTGITSYLCESIGNTSDCTKIENSTDFSQISCWSALSHIQYQIWHNGSEGITKMEAYFWVKRLPKFSNVLLLQLTTEVRYKWVGSSRKIFKRSGNPGYLTGKPILAGRKIYHFVNGTSHKKEAIELSLDSKDWLSLLGSEKGICSSKERIPINFRENSLSVCSVRLNKNNFTKENCIELQNNIFKLLVGNDIINQSQDNFFNKFIATFGNSRVEETKDWVQVLIDLFPVISSQTSFKSNYYQLTCKNIITDLFVDIVYSKIGSFLAPQAKILGVAFQFGKHKDLAYYCDTPGCENTSLVQYFKLSSAVHFVDVTEPATDAFAEPLSLEAKLPHDFFYPFFSKGSSRQIYKFVLVLSFCIVF